MSPSDVLILGCGFTGQRVARKLISRGVRVLCTNRDGSKLEGAETLKLEATDAGSLADLHGHLREGMLVLYSIPSVKVGDKLTDPAEDICHVLTSCRPRRMVYLSTTGVYGGTRFVDEHTPPAPNTERALLRIDAERAVSRGPWSSLILRPAAIYGPGRGVHTAVRAGHFQIPHDTQRMTSRIHVDDLAEQAMRALLSEITGAFPIADEEPASSLAVARLSAELLGVALPPASNDEELSETRRADRRVDGSAIRRALNLSLQYPSYRQGIPACLEAC